MEEGFLSKKYTVTKSIDFCYGHRLLNYDGKCRNLHGHNAKVEIDIATDTLDARGMAYDFGEIKTKIKTWIDAELDHRMILNEKDEAVAVLKKMDEPIFILKENPTAENIAKLVFEKVEQLGFPVKEVRLWETPDSCATYHG